jgi:hypothetical protein
LPEDDDNVGLVCSVCLGKGIVEPYALKIERRFPFFLAIGLVSLGFLVLFLSKKVGLDPDKVLPFVGTLLGSITGYYFGGERARALDAKVEAQGWSTTSPEAPDHLEA